MNNEYSLVNTVFLYEKLLEEEHKLEEMEAYYFNQENYDYEEEPYNGDF